VKELNCKELFFDGTRRREGREFRKNAGKIEGKIGRAFDYQSIRKFDFGHTGTITLEGDDILGVGVWAFIAF